MDLLRLVTYGLEYYGLYYGTYKGIVISTDDPDGLGRLQIHCPTIHGKNYPPVWAWPVCPAVHKGGIWFIPDVGQWVHVRFDHGRLEYPLWDGGWWGKQSDQTPQDNLLRNQQYATHGPWATTLSATDESTFQAWVKQNNVPWQDTPNADYDMRGFWKGYTTGDPRAVTAVNPNDNRLHFTDTWKTPYHASFSNESQYALPSCPFHWTDNDDLVDGSGKVVFSEKNPSLNSTNDVTSDMVPSKVVIATPEGLKVVIDRQAKSILLEQSSGNSVLIDPSGIALNHHGDVKITAQGEVDITAQTKLKITAPEVDITGNVNVTGAGVIKPAPWTTPVP